MRILIIRSYASVVNGKLYNLQHIGLAKAFIRKGHQCDIIYWSGNVGEKHEIIKYQNSSINVYWLNGIVIEKNILFKKSEIEKRIATYDIIQVEEFEQLFSCNLAISHPEKVVVYHGPYKSDYKKLYSIKSILFDICYKKRLLKRNVQYITKTDMAKETLLQKGFHNIIVSPVGLDLDKFKHFTFKNKKIKFNTTLRLLYIGELCDRRSIDFLINILSEVRKSGIDATLSLIGTGKEKYINQCKTLIHKLDLKKYVTFLGAVNQEKLPEIYFDHDIFLLASKFEIFGMVLLEAMYLECPVISSSNGGSKTLIKNTQNGFIMNDFDVKSWVNLICDIYNNQYDISSIIRNAHDDIIKYYSWDYSADIFLKTYYNLLKRNNA